MQVREGRRPRRPYNRVRRDEILLLCRVARRKPTPEELHIIWDEAKEFEKAGYHHSSISEEDDRLIAQLYLSEPDDEEGGDEHSLPNTPTL